MKEPAVNNNIIIAIFMGAVKDGAWTNLEKEITHWTMDMGKDRTQNQRYWPSNCLKYHFKWDWLMPVMAKCEELGAVFAIHKRYCIMNGITYCDPVEADKMLNVYYAVSAFIHSYNAVVEEKLKTSN